MCRSEQSSPGCALFQPNLVWLVLWRVARLFPVPLRKTPFTGPYQASAGNPLPSEALRRLLLSSGRGYLGLCLVLPALQFLSSTPRLPAATSLAVAGQYDEQVRARVQ